MVGPVSRCALGAPVSVRPCFGAFSSRWLQSISAIGPPGKHRRRFRLSTETRQRDERVEQRLVGVARARLQSLAKQMHHAIEKGLPKLALWSTHDSNSVAPMSHLPRLS